MADGGDGASPVLKNAVSELKNPLTLLGREAPAIGSKMGGGVGAVLSIPAIARDVGEGKMSAGQAIAREGVGLVAGAAAGGLVAPAVGPVGGAVLGVVVGNGASRAVDFAWEPLQEFGSAAADGGYKVGRLGRL